MVIAGPGPALCPSITARHVISAFHAPPCSRRPLHALPCSRRPLHALPCSRRPLHALPVGPYVQGTGGVRTLWAAHGVACHHIPPQSTTIHHSPPQHHAVHYSPPQPTTV
ncbi:hypothetical protein ACOMHN_052812 [Nucella lapillus]